MIGHPDSPQEKPSQELRPSFPVLIAEDHPATRRLLEKILISAGYETESAENGRKAIELFNERFFPIIVADWDMPEMDGIELCRAVRKNAVAGYVYIVLLTVKESKHDIITGLEAGADDYLTKPFDRTELVARLNAGKRILELERFLREANERSKREIEQRKQAEKAQGKLVRELQDALASVKALGGLLPICSYCKKIRDDNGYWNQIEAYIEEHSEADFSHSICPKCAKELSTQLENENKRPL